MVGGFLFRIGIGAMPFLLPLLLQIGFGLSPFESGSLTFAAAAGAMAMKFTASTILRRCGFRRVLIVNGVISALFLASYGLFTPRPPHWLLLAALLAGGFFRSLEFTALNALGYADIDQARMSRATSFASVVAADVGRGRRRGRGGLVESLQFALGDGATRRARHDAQLRRRRADLAEFGGDLRAAGARRRRGSFGPARRAEAMRRRRSDRTGRAAPSRRGSRSPARTFRRCRPGSPSA